jgi:hypothetical protein
MPATHECNPVPLCPPHTHAWLQPPLWLDPSQWRGMLMLIDNNGRPYFPLLLQLPPTVLEAALGLGPASQDGESVSQGGAVAVAPVITGCM